MHSYADAARRRARRRSTWPELDEKAPASMCYTSGTTGDPKGVVYSHRSTYLHALATLANTVTGASEADRALVVVPMFHVNAWGIPYALDAVRRDDADARPAHEPGRAVRHRRGREGHADLRRADAVGRHPAGGRGARARPLVGAHGHVGRRGDPALADGGVPGQVRPAHHPGLGHDRDLAGGRHGAPAGRRRARHATRSSTGG